MLPVKWLWIYCEYSVCIYKYVEKHSPSSLKIIKILTNNVFIMYNLLYYCTHPKILATSQILFYFIAICLKKTISRLLLKKMEKYDSVKKKLQKFTFTVKKTCHAKKIAKIVIKSKPYV